MKPNRFLDASALLLVLAMVGALAGSVLLGRFHAGLPDAAHGAPGVRMVEAATVGCVWIFVLASAVLWLAAVLDWWKGAMQRSIPRNCAYLALLIGFSWLAALVWYCHARDRRHGLRDDAGH